jgi:hypothetical protein
MEAQALIRVPSTEKYPVESSSFTFGWASTAARNWAAMSPAGGLVAVLGEGRVISGDIIDPKANEPPKEQIVFEPLHQLALRSNRVESPQEHGS